MQPLSDRRALIVEDDPASREALRRLLRALEYEAEAVGTVAEAGPRLGSTDYLVLDLHLPDGSGVDLLRQVRERGLRVRVAVTTGSADEALLATAAALRPDAVFRKPVDFGELLQWLRAPRPRS